MVTEDFRTMQAGLMTGQIQELMFGHQQVTGCHPHKVVDDMVNS